MPLLAVIESRGNIAITLAAHCNNKNCSNFTTNHDLAGSWCCDACFVESECGERPTDEELEQHEAALIAEEKTQFPSRYEV